MNNYGGKYNNGKSDLNDGMAFAMVTEEKEKGKDDKNEKKQHITCFRCKKKGHYSNECTEELPAAQDKKGTSLLINKEDVALVTTVENNINKYTVREYSYAKKHATYKTSQVGLLHKI